MSAIAWVPWLTTLWRISAWLHGAGTDEGRA